MIIDHRTYTTKPVHTGNFLELWERMALPYQMKYLGGFVGMFTCDVGDLSQVVHMWRYEDQGDRERRRAGYVRGCGLAGICEGAEGLRIDREDGNQDP